MKKETAKEKIQLEVLGSYSDTGKLEENKIKENIRNNIPKATVEGEEFPLIVTLDGYTFTIDSNGKVELSQLRPNVKQDSIKITLENDEEIPNEGVEEGTKLKIDFEASIEGGTITSISPTKPYITDGIEKQVTFKITGEVEGEYFTTDKTIDFKDKYKKAEIISQDKIIQNPSSYYGSLVTGYECEGEGVSAWRLFFADEENFYLIADKYINCEDMPAGKNGSKVDSNSSTFTCLNNVYEDYTGTEWIAGQTNGKDNCLAKKWLSEYLNYNGTATSQEIGIKRVAYLVDTSIWEKYSGTQAEYVIGTPTLELFCESYKQTHPNLYMEYKMMNEVGYAVKANTDTEYGSYRYEVIQDDFNGIYNQGNGSQMWLASPSYLGGGRVLYQYGRGITYDGMCALKPIVCLKSGTELERNKDGTLKIKNDN